MKIITPRELLLIEIERRCRATSCNARTQIGLTKEEARAYRGFECERCGSKWDDELSERDVPEWWEELKITGLDTIREIQNAGPEEPGEVISRLSNDFRRNRQIPSGEDPF
jgi:DNA-directed RNA polymerase subunit RPC12/RpoP